MSEKILGLGKDMRLLSLALTLLSSCAGQRMLTRKDYIKMPDVEIRNIFLQQTPIGSREESVRKVMLEKFGYRLRKILVIDNPMILESTKNDPDPFIRKTELNDYHLNATLASYGWGKHFFMMGEVINASWLFSKDGILKDIRVLRYTDGA